jgi:hypothetical protein
MSLQFTSMAGPGARCLYVTGFEPSVSTEKFGNFLSESFPLNLTIQFQWDDSEGAICNLEDQIMQLDNQTVSLRSHTY